MSSIFAWNMRGFNMPRKQKAVRYWVSAAKLSFGCLLETRVKEENFQKIFDSTFPGWSYVHNYSSHRLGRIWVCWSDAVEIIPVSTSAQMITVWVRFKASGDTFLASFVYASNCVVERRELWSEMETISNSVAGDTNAWIIQGDFNVALSSLEHSRLVDSAADRSAIRDFQNVVRSCDMVDIAQVGPSFTWTNSQDGNPISKKLDRVMSNSYWIGQFPNSYVTFESGGVSDHMRMHIQLREAPQGNSKPFKFFHHTASHPRFLEVVSRIWSETAPLYHSRSALKLFQDKLKALKYELRGLNRDMFGDLPGKVKHAYNDLCAKQTEAMRNPQTSTFEAASDAWEYWHHISGIEEQFYYQKSRVQWLGLGDRNSRFFHKVTQSRNARNTIRRIVTADGRILTSPMDIKAEAASHFESFLNGSQQGGSELAQEEIADLVDFRCSNEAKTMLMQPVEVSEITETLFSMPANKAPGLDGFPMEFYKAAWPVIGKDFITAIQSFFMFGFMPHSVNATLLSLIPKTTDAEKMTDFRPIACCNVIYKVVSKILAKRLKATLPEAIELNQCAFVEGRLLLENVLLATELVRDYHKPSASSRAAIKLDIAKAFDTVSWSFIENTLRAMNYPDMFVTWIMRCISTAAFSVSVNGELAGFFTSSRGIRQGCSVSPYLYVIVSNVLSKLLNKAVIEGSIGL